MKFVVDLVSIPVYTYAMSNEKSALTIRLNKDDHKRYRVYAAEHDITFKDIFMVEMERRIKEAEKKKEEK